MGEGYRFLAVPVGGAENYVLDKKKATEEFATYFLIRLMKMFHYEGLPKEIPEDCLHKMLLTEGFVFFTKFKSRVITGEERDQFYVFRGRMGDVCDAYYRPTKIIISNPGANCIQDFELNQQDGGTYYGEKGVIIRNDTLYHGLMPLILRYSYLLAENILTMRSADVFLRIIALISGQDDKTLLSANEFIKAIEDGKMKAVAEGKFFDGVKMQSPPSNNGSYLTQFIEYQQYFLGSFFNEIGLNANFNMKRESIAKSESSLNEDSMLPLCQNMLMCRQQDFEVVNKMFGLNIKVSFDSAWLQNALEIAMELQNMRSGGNQMANSLASGGNDDQAAEENQGEERTAGTSHDGNGYDSEGKESRAGENQGDGSRDSEANASGGENEESNEGSGFGVSGAEEERAPEEGSSVEDELVTDEQIEQAAGLADAGTANELAEEGEENEISEE